MNFMLAAGVVFALGDYLGLTCPTYASCWLAGFLLGTVSSIACFFLEKTNKKFLYSCFLTILMAGALLGAKANVPLPSFWLKLRQQPGWLSGEIVPGSVHLGSRQGWSFLLKEKRTGKCLKIAVRNWPREKTVPEYGSVQAFCQISSLESFANPGVPDREFYGKVQNIWGKGAVEAVDLNILPTERPWEHYVLSVHKRIKTLLTQTMSKADGAVLKGMVLGGTEDITADTLENFSTVGITHLLAVSGTHVAVLTGAMLKVLSLLGTNVYYANFCTALILLAYGLLCGFKPSVWRAVLMAWFYLGGNVGGNKGDKGAIIGAALLVLLMFKPWWLFAIGFQLSFLATAGLIFLLPKVQEELKKYLPPWLATGIAIPVAAQLPMLPLLFYYFHRLSLVSLLANILVVPLLSFVLVLTMFGLGISFLWTFAGKLFLIGAAQLLGLAVGLIEILAKLPLAALNIGPWPLGFIVAFYILLWALFQLYPLAFLKKKYRLRLIAGCLTFFVISYGFAYFHPQPFTAYFLAVGQGDSALLVTPHKKVILIDTGGLGENFDTGRRIIVPVLRYLGLNRVNILLLSHGHHDHAGGALGVAKSLPIDRVLLPQEAPSGDVAALLKQVEKTSKIETMWTGQKLILDNCQLEMMDIPTVIGDNSNESCALVKVSYLGHSILFTGDALAQQEFAAINKNIESTVLKVSHHGSASSSCEEFIRKVKPQLAIISCGKGNRFGHPHQEVLARFREHNVQVLRTDERGAIKITFDQKRIDCNCCKKCYNFEEK